MISYCGDGAFLACVQLVVTSGMSPQWAEALASSAPCVSAAVFSIARRCRSVDTMTAYLSRPSVMHRITNDPVLRPMCVLAVAVLCLRCPSTYHAALLATAQV